MRVGLLQLGVFFVMLLGPALGQAKTYVQMVCPSITVVSSKPIRFTDIEKRFLCGDPKTDAWKHIPLSQAAYHMQGFLQTRGYFTPTFVEEKTHMTVKTGARTFVKKVVADGAPPSLNIHKRRKVKGSLLTPELLSQLESWTRGRLQSHGYPCPEVASEADPTTGIVRVHITAGPYQAVHAITEDPTPPGLAAGVLRRYDAFLINHPYNADLLAISENRVETEGFLQSTHFVTECGKQGAELRQRSIPGPPRLLSFGAGVNTEGIVSLKGTWSHTRMGRLGSGFEVTGTASYRRQELDIIPKWYFFDPPSRWHFEPLLAVVHENEPQYRYLSWKARMSPAVTWDDQNKQQTVIFGPTLEYVRTYKGGEETLSRFLSLETYYELTSHYFEFYRASPRRGYHFVALFDVNHNRLLSDISAEQLHLSGEKLWNIGHFDPPLLVLGVRGGFYSTYVSDDLVDSERVPPRFRYYLGGSQDLRGFSRQELPNIGLGALSAAFSSLEARATGVLPYRIQPFVFADFGAVGRRPFQLDAPVYWSPGIGLRWESPIGVIRGTAAHGFLVGNGDSSLSHWQFYFSFGEEF